jgi:hypothetical protein
MILKNLDSVREDFLKISDFKNAMDKILVVLVFKILAKP